MVVGALPHVVTETVENNEIFKCFKNFNITATEQDIDELVTIDNESPHVFHEEILKESNFFFEEQQLVNEDENIASDEGDVDTVSQTSQANKTLYAKSVILEGEWS